MALLGHWEFVRFHSDSKHTQIARSPFFQWTFQSLSYGTPPWLHFRKPYAKSWVIWNIYSNLQSAVPFFNVKLQQWMVHSRLKVGHIPLPAVCCCTYHFFTPNTKATSIWNYKYPKCWSDENEQDKHSMYMYLLRMTLTVVRSQAAAIWITAWPTPLLAPFWITVSPWIQKQC